MDMAEVGCGLLRLVMGLVEIGVDHGVVSCGLLRLWVAQSGLWVAQIGEDRKSVV